jgi:hypothetical protein
MSSETTAYAGEALILSVKWFLSVLVFMWRVWEFINIAARFQPLSISYSFPTISKSKIANRVIWLDWQTFLVAFIV